MSLKPQLPRVFPSAVHRLAAAAEVSPDHAALVCGADRLTYEEYLRCVAGLAAGAQVAPISPLRTEHEIAPLLVDVDPTAIIHDTGLATMIEPVEL